MERMRRSMFLFHLNTKRRLKAISLRRLKQRSVTMTAAVRRAAKEAQATPATPAFRTNTLTASPAMLTALAAAEMHMVTAVCPWLRQSAAPAL